MPVSPSVMRSATTCSADAEDCSGRPRDRRLAMVASDLILVPERDEVIAEKFS